MTETIDESSFASKVSLNMITNIARVVVMALVGFMMIPYYIDQFGMATYAIIPLATSLTTYVLVASDSLSESFARFMVLAIHDRNGDRANVVYSSSVLGMAKFILMLIPVIFLVALVSPFVFSTGDASDIEVQTLFFMVLLSSLMVSFSTCLNSVFMAYNQLYIMYVIRIVHCLIQVFLVIGFFMVQGPSMIFLGFSFVLASALLILLSFYYVRRLDPSLRISRNLYDKKLVKEMCNLGVWTMVSKLGNILFIQTSVIFVNIFLGSAVQAEFSIAANIISTIGTACLAVTSVGVPLVYKDYHDGDNGKTVSTIVLFTKLSGLIMVFPLAYLCIFTPQVMETWLGSTYTYLVMMTVMMVPLCVAKCTMDILEVIPIVYSRAKEMGIATIVAGCLNIALVVLFLGVFKTDVYGACIAWDISIAVLYFGFYPLFVSKLIGIKKSTFYGPLVTNHIVFFVLFLIGLVLMQFYTLPVGWIPLLASVLIGFVVYALIILRFGFGKDEKETIVTYFPRFVQGFIAKLM